MAKIKTRKPVSLDAVDRRMRQLGMPVGLVARRIDATGEWEMETHDPSVSNADLQRVITDVPEAPQVNGAEVAAADREARKAEARALLDKGSWQAKDTEAAVRLLLTEHLEG